MCVEIDAFEFFVGDGGDAGIEFGVCGKFVDYVETVFAFGDGGICPGVEDGDVEVIFLEGFHNVDNLGVAYVGAVLLECKSHHKNMAAEYLYAFLEHQFDGLVGNIFAHAVVHAASGEDDLGVIAVALCALRKIVWVDSDAVSTDQSRLERQEVPLGRSCFENVLCVYSHEGEDFRQLVDESNVYVTLRVLDYLGGLGNLDGGSKVCAGGDYGRVYFIDELAYLGSRA